MENALDVPYFPMMKSLDGKLSDMRCAGAGAVVRFAMGEPSVSQRPTGLAGDLPVFLAGDSWGSARSLACCSIIFVSLCFMVSRQSSLKLLEFHHSK